MSNSDRKAIICLLVLFYIAEKYSGILAKEHRLFINSVMREYIERSPISKIEQRGMDKVIVSIDKQIAALEMSSSITLTLAMGVMISEHFLEFVVSRRRKKAWELLHAFCNRNSLIKHTRKNNESQIELDKSDAICQIILNAA